MESFLLRFFMSIFTKKPRLNLRIPRFHNLHWTTVLPEEKKLSDYDREQIILNLIYTKDIPRICLQQFLRILVLHNTAPNFIPVEHIWCIEPMVDSHLDMH